MKRRSGAKGYLALTAFCWLAVCVLLWIAVAMYTQDFCPPPGTEWQMEGIQWMLCLFS